MRGLGFGVQGLHYGGLGGLRFGLGAQKPLDTAPFGQGGFSRPGRAFGLGGLRDGNGSIHGCPTDALMLEAFAGVVRSNLEMLILRMIKIVTTRRR